MRYLITFILLTICLQTFAPPDNVILIPTPKPIDPFKELYQAQCMVESGNDPDSINDEEQAYGIVQIRQIRLDEYYKQTGVRYTLQDCLDPIISYRIWYHFARQYNSQETIAKRWNGSGPMTEVYWGMVLAILNVKNKDKLN